MVEMDFKAIEEKWQKKWEEEKVFFAEKNSSKKKFYCLEMFPYPSGSGLHIGHALNFTITDIFARFKRMQGFNVLYPIGYDALGLPAENAAIQAGTHPEGYTNNSIKNFRLQQRKMGWSYDSSTFLNTADPNYYRWDQWIFLKLLEKGLAYKKISSVNWCKKCNTVLANEQVHDGKCWRHADTAVEIKKLDQWFFKTTHYADELYENLENMNWPERTKIMQKNWIGKSYGTEIDFEIFKEVKFASYLLIEKSFNLNLEKELIKFGEFKIEEVDKDWGKFFRVKVSLEKEDDFIDFVKKNILIKNDDGGSWYVDSGETTNKVIFKNKVININSEKGKKEFLEYGRKLGIPEEQLDVKIAKDKWPIFTTRPDTLFGVTFMVVSAQHSKLNELVTEKQKKEVEKFLKKLKSVSEKELESMEKEGVFTGSYAVNPINGERVPIYAGNFVLADYGSGMVMAVPAHDQRDFEFAKKYNLPIKIIVAPVLGEVNEDKDIKKMFETIKEVYSEFEKDKIKIWFNGTFGVIGYYNKLFTKPNDVDCGVLEKYFEKAKKIILGAGYKKIYEKDNGRFKVITLEKKGIVVQMGTFGKDLGDKVVSIGKTKYRVPSADWLAQCYRITSKKERRKGMNDYERAVFLELISGKMDKAYTGEGVLVNSEEFNGLENEKAKEEITKYLEQKKLGRKVVNFKLRDWGISRQRYWGTPIPIINCEKCGAVAVAEKDLPVKLPHDVKFGKGNPLESNEEWMNVNCPKCGGKGKRETDTMDTFVNSSWYFLRYCDPQNSREIFDRKKVNYWCPVDFYVGGAEHACMHLIYSRFYVKFLRDLGLLEFDEPAIRLFHQGMLHAEGGAKMSKSLGNVINPLDIIEKYNADSLRLALMSFAAPDKDTDWDEKVLIGSYKLLNRVVDYFDSLKLGKTSEEIEIKLNESIKKVTEHIENLRYRKATIELRQILESIFKEEEISKESLEKVLKMLSLFCPHIAEELWEKIKGKGFVCLSSWPKVEESKIKKIKIEIDLEKKIFEDVSRMVKILEEKKQKIKKIHLYVLPFEFGKIDSKKLSKQIGKEIFIYSTQDKKKYDPEGRSKKARPGMPGIWFE